MVIDGNMKSDSCCATISYDCRVSTSTGFSTFQVVSPNYPQPVDSGSRALGTEIDIICIPWKTPKPLSVTVMWSKLSADYWVKECGWLWGRSSPVISLNNRLFVTINLFRTNKKPNRDNTFSNHFEAKTWWSDTPTPNKTGYKTELGRLACTMLCPEAICFSSSEATPWIK